jgi:hypothetical protein
MDGNIGQVFHTIDLLLHGLVQTLSYHRKAEIRAYELTVERMEQNQILL